MKKTFTFNLSENWVEIENELNKIIDTQFEKEQEKRLNNIDFDYIYITINDFHLANETIRDLIIHIMNDRHNKIKVSLFSEEEINLKNNQIKYIEEEEKEIEEEKLFFIFFKKPKFILDYVLYMKTQYLILFSFFTILILMYSIAFIIFLIVAIPFFITTILINRLVKEKIFYKNL